MFFLVYFLEIFRNGPEVMKPLLEYLNHSGCCFKLAETLNEIPNEWTINLVKSHLKNNLRSIFDRRFHSSFGRIMALSILERAKQQKQQLISRPIRIDRDRFVHIFSAAPALKKHSAISISASQYPRPSISFFTS